MEIVGSLQSIGFRNGIGNFITLTPCLQALAEIGTVDIVLDDDWERKEPIIDIAEKCPFIREVILYNEYSKRSYDINYMSFHNAIDRVFSAMNVDREVPFNRARHWIDGDMLHEIEYYIMECEDWFDFKLPIYDQYMPLTDFTTHFEIKDDSKKHIILSNGYIKTGEGVWDHKSYPHWRELISLLKDIFYDYDIILVGGEDDKSWSEPLFNEFDIEDACGKLSITQTADLIDSCEAIITTDTAAMHIADALKIPGVALFGSTLVSKNGPYNNTIIPIRSPLECAPCQGTHRTNDCKDRSQCMAAIEPRMIISALRHILN